jgi:hypothetical protein
MQPKEWVVVGNAAGAQDCLVCGVILVLRSLWALPVDVGHPRPGKSTYWKSRQASYNP